MSDAAVQTEAVTIFDTPALVRITGDTHKRIPTL